MLLEFCQFEVLIEFKIKFSVYSTSLASSINSVDLYIVSLSAKLSVSQSLPKDDFCMKKVREKIDEIDHMSVNFINILCGIHKLS